VTATFELPGLTSDGVAIDVHQNRLTVTGDSAASESEEEKNYIVRERRSGKFSRTLQLPFGTKVGSWFGFLSFDGLLSSVSARRCQSQDGERHLEDYLPKDIS